MYRCEESDPDFPSAREAPHIWECDICGIYYEAEGSFTEAWESAKEKGWRCFKNQQDEWEHRCPTHVRT